MERTRLYRILVPIFILVPLILWVVCYFFITNPTTVFLVRHADRIEGLDSISPNGLIRANELKRILDEASIDVIYASQYNRTQETAAPLATSLGLTVQLYSTNDIAQLATDIKTIHKGKRVLVVGHSNTVPQTIGALGFSPQPADIPHNEYDHLYMAIIHGHINDQLIKMEYGANTP